MSTARTNSTPRWRYRDHDPITRSWLHDADTVAGKDARELILEGVTG